MLRHWPWIGAFFFYMSGCWLWATPPLTRVQDTLYKADGSRFTGALYIEWATFRASDGTTISNQTVRVPVVDGAFRTQLVPTTSAQTPNAYYTVRYIGSDGLDGLEKWYVPPSSTPVTLNVVRNPLAAGTGGSSGDTSSGSVTVAITDVTGLSTELTSRPQKGTGFAISRTAVINANGQIDAALGNLSDCVHVDGTSAPCPTSSGTTTSSSNTPPGFVDSEIPAGTINGVNATFTLANAPTPAASLALYRNGVLQSALLDYTLAGASITFRSGSLPQSGDSLVASYRLTAAADSASGGSATAIASSPASASGPQVLCSSAGTLTGNTTFTRLGSCSIPSSLLNPGDRLEVRYDFLHSGTATGAEAQVQFGGILLPSRVIGAVESRLAGRLEISFSNNAVYFNAESWGSATPIAGQAGVLNFAGGNAVLEVDGRLASTTGDQLQLGQFTVVRYPARLNP